MVSKCLAEAIDRFAGLGLLVLFVLITFEYI